MPQVDGIGGQSHGSKRLPPEESLQKALLLRADGDQSGGAKAGDEGSSARERSRLVVEEERSHHTQEPRGFQPSERSRAEPRQGNQGECAADKQFPHPGGEKKKRCHGMFRYQHDGADEAG